MKKLFSMIDEVKKLLTKYPSLRDNDDKLMANIWCNRIDNLDNETATNVLIMLAKRKLPSYESISRCRRKIQEKNPHLRGEKWNERHGRAKEIRREIAR
jgi:hypothetical protein